MKQKDIVLIIVVVFMGAVLSIFVSKFVFKSSDKNLQSDIVSAISAEFKQPDKKYFNPESINPTQTIRIGNGSNNQPFNQ